MIVVSDTLIMSSRSGELHRELWLLRIFTKSPRTTNFIAFILNGGGGGGIGINGDWLPAFRVSSLKVTALLGRGGRPEFLRRGGSGGEDGDGGIWLLRFDGGGGGGGGGADTEWIFLLLPSPFRNRLWKTEGGGGGGGGGGGTVVLLVNSSTLSS